jgi:hypothetical protein
LVRLTGERDRSADDPFLGSEAALPESMGEHDCRRCARCIFGCGEQRSETSACLEGREDRRCHVRDAYRFRAALGASEDRLASRERAKFFQ